MTDPENKPSAHFEVKPLRWVSDEPNGDGLWGNGLFAYQIRYGGDGHYRWRRAQTATWVLADERGIEAAKDAAQADYERHLLAVIDPGQTPDDAAAALEAVKREARIEALREAERVCERVRTQKANGPMPEGSCFDYEQAIAAMIEKEQADE